MAIFDKNGQTSNVNNGATIIAKYTSIKVEIDTTCSVHIDGSIEGNIKSTNVVTIGKSGKALGEISAISLIVSGEFDGTADCESVEILPGGYIKGKIITGELIIEKQGFFEGESKKKGHDIATDIESAKKEEEKE